LESPDSKGYSSRNLKYMRKFANFVNDETKVQTVSALLSWHNTLLFDCTIRTIIYMIQICTHWVQKLKSILPLLMAEITWKDVRTTVVNFAIVQHFQIVQRSVALLQWKGEYQSARKCLKVLKGHLIIDGNKSVTNCYQLKIPIIGVGME